MIQSLMKVAWRNFQRERAYAFLNVFGLTIGITASLLLFLYIIDELSYDRFHEKADRIYRVVTKLQEGDDEHLRAHVQMPLADELKTNYPEVQHVVRLFSSGRELFQQAEKQFYEEKFYYADSTYFKMFTHDFISGNPLSCFDEPFSIVISETTAIKYFGHTNALDSTLFFVDRREEYRVTGIMRDVPGNSHLQFDALMSFNSLPEIRAIENWGRLGVLTYVELPENYDARNFDRNLRQVVANRVAPLFEKRGITVSYELQAITDIHLYSHIEEEEEAGGDINFVFIMVFIAIFIIVIACINYMNLATARAARRAREVGVRKALGSFRYQLIVQYFVESFLYIFISIFLSLFLCVVLLPGFNFVAGKTVLLDDVFSLPVAIALALLFIGMGFLAGSYPALYLSRHQPAVVLKTARLGTRSDAPVRKSLVTLQFAISIFMLVATVVVAHQLDFLMSKDPGFDKEHVLRINIDDDRSMRRQLEVLKERLVNAGVVKRYGTASATPGDNVRKTIVKVQDDRGEMTERTVDFFAADYDFIHVLGMKLASGRNFSTDILSDTMQAVLVNEAMVRKMSWVDPIGKIFQMERGGPRQVIGVFKDYHHKSLFNEIEPLAIVFNRNNSYSYLKLSPGNVQTRVAEIGRHWKEVFPHKPFDYAFLDDAYDGQYDREQKRSAIFTVFSFLAISIACLGLIGLTNFSTEQRAKEISIRKVAGASTWSIIALISKEFLGLVLIGAVLAFPTAYFFLDAWLNVFPYKINLEEEGFTFIYTALVAAAFAVSTVTTQALRAARMNPIMALKAD